MILNAIKLDLRLRYEHQRALLRYLRDERTLRRQDWVMLSDAVDALGDSVMIVDGKEQRFRQFYTRWYLGREWLRVAILRETAWEVFSLPPCDDQRRVATVDEVALILPNTCVFLIDSLALTALGYDQLKQRVLMLQLAGGETSDE